MKLKPGDAVRVVGSRGTAKIRAILTRMHGALLEKQIDGFRRWNLDELRLVKRGKPVGEPKELNLVRLRRLLCRTLPAVGVLSKARALCRRLLSLRSNFGKPESPWLLHVLLFGRPPTVQLFVL